MLFRYKIEEQSIEYYIYTEKHSINHDVKSEETPH